MRKRLILYVGILSTSSAFSPYSAHATRPTVRTPLTVEFSEFAEFANKNPKGPITLNFNQAVEQNANGLDRENDVNRKLIITQASDYLEYRLSSTPSHRQKWLAKCALAKAKPENFFCVYENARANRLPSAHKRSNSDIRHQIAEDIRANHFEKITTRAYPDVVGSISKLGEINNLYPISDKVLENKCVPSSLSSALAYKIEEQFPDAKAIDYASRLYRQASECGQDFASAQASFRLALIKIWKKKCEDVPQLMNKVESIALASQYHSRAKYWRFHCATIAGNKEEQKSARDGLLQTYPLSFHNLAANGEDNMAMLEVLNRPEPSVKFRSIIRPDMNSVIRSGEASLRIGAPQILSEIFDYYAADLGGMEPETRLYAAILLNRSGQSLTKFKILSELFMDSPRMISSATLKLLFPLWYFDLIKPRIERDGQNIDPLLILSLIRQESAFNKDARSLVGARGLMQVMPATARTIASVRTNSLFDPKTNIQIGTRYFSKKLHQYNGDVELTLAAYNAGFSRVDQWVKRYPTDDKILFLDFIPFKETREYVATILRNYYWYVKLYDNNDNNGVLAQTSESTESATPKTHKSGAKLLAIISANAGLASKQD
jgi:soluble lytic murein transglycosylase